MSRIAFNPIFESYFVAAALAAGLLGLLFVGPRSRQLTDLQRRALLGWRSLLILLLMLAVLRPAIVATTAQPLSAVLLILFDQSRSMQQPAASLDLSRWEAQRAVLKDLEKELAQFDDRFELRVYGYDRELREVALENGVVALPSAPSGDETDIGGALSTALRKELGRRVAGILLLGDGAQTATSPRADLQEVTHDLARLDAPLYSVTFGPAGDIRQSRDIAVENMPDHFSVFAKNELLVEGAVRVRGYVNKEIPLELVVQNEQGEVRLFGPRHVTAMRDNEAVPVSFSFIPSEPGEYRLTLRAAAQAGELLSQNNELTAFLTVLEGGLRVLYLYGDLNGEQQQLRHGIDAAQDIRLDDQFISLLDRKRWPIDLGKRLDQNAYDAILVESVDAAALSPADMNRVAERVEAGAGFMMIGGYSSFGAGGFLNTSWAELLPIEMGRFDRQDLDPRTPISRDLHLWGDLRLTPVRPHPVTRLAAESDNVKLWQSLPPLQGANKLRLKAASQVLLQTAGNEPVLVAGSYGRGRVLAFGGNTTGRWRRYGYDNVHRRLWRQIVLWLAQRDDPDEGSAWIRLEQRRFSVGQEVEFTAGASDPSGEPLRDVDLHARLVDEQGGAIDIALTRVGDAFRGVTPPLPAPGDFRIELTAARNGAPAGNAQARLHAIENDVELSDPVADHHRMARLANATRDAGGRPVAAEEVTALVEDIRNAHRQARVEVEAKWELGESDWSAWLLFLLVVATVTGEWVCRKRWGLV